MFRRGLVSGVALMVLAGGCTETVVRCREGFRADDMMDGRTRCVPADAAPVTDVGGGGDGAMDLGAVTDAGADAAMDARADATDATDVAVAMDVCNRAAADPPGDGQDTNCDGVDGVLGDTIFVAQGGTDTNAGFDPALPVRSVTRALAIARDTTRRSILIGVGSYDALPIMLGDGGDDPAIAIHRLVDGVTLSGRYLGEAGGWVARAADASQRSLLRGQSAAAYIQDLRTSVTFHDVDLLSEEIGMAGEVSCYGLFVVGSGVVTIDRGRVRVCAGSDAPTMSPTAMVGAEGSPGSSAAGGGGGGSGCAGGNGGQGGTNGTRGGTAGAAGAMTRTGAGASGGAGGTMGVPLGQEGDPGATGQHGRVASMGPIGQSGYLFPEGEDGERGGGGGGGGGGFATGVDMPGGGGGGGGCGGEGGRRGTSGGASIGVYAWGSGIRVALNGVTIETGGGGDGSPGAQGGTGGVGGAGGTGLGGQGGRGGRGGHGGDGSPGAGGPSFGVVVMTGAVVDATGVTWTLGTGGLMGNRTAGRARLEQIFRAPATPTP